MSESQALSTSPHIPAAFQDPSNTVSFSFRSPTLIQVLRPIQVHASGSLVTFTNIPSIQTIRQSLVRQLAWMENLITDYNAKADQLSEDIKDIDRNMVKHITVNVVSVSAEPNSEYSLLTVQLQGASSSSVMDVSLLMQSARESFAEKLASLEKLIDVHDRQANQLWLDIKALDHIIDDALRATMVNGFSERHMPRLALIII